MIAKTIQKNKQGLFESKLELVDILKANGKTTLSPRQKEPDSFQSKLMAGSPKFFRVRIAELNLATIQIKIDLKSIEEINMAIKHDRQLFSKT